MDKTECYLWLRLFGHILNRKQLQENVLSICPYQLHCFLYTLAYTVFDTCGTSQTGWDRDNNLTEKVVKPSKNISDEPVHISQVNRFIGRR